MAIQHSISLKDWQRQTTSHQLGFHRTYQLETSSRVPYDGFSISPVVEQQGPELGDDKEEIQTITVVTVTAAWKGQSPRWIYALCYADDVDETMETCMKSLGLWDDGWMDAMNHLPFGKKLSKLLAVYSKTCSVNS